MNCALACCGIVVSDLGYYGYYPRRLCRSASVERLRPSVNLFVCLFVCLSAA